MKNFQSSDYALNKYSEGIVYPHVDGSRTVVTLRDYLAENPGKTDEDFRALKAESDAIYLKQANAGNAQTRKNVSLDALNETALRFVPSAEDLLVATADAREAAEKRRKRLADIKRALDKLTEIQRRRYLLHVVEGLSSWQIARAEGSNQKTVYDSLRSAEKKIKKFFPES